MNLFKFKTPTVHFTKEDLQPLLEEIETPKEETKNKNNCTIDYLNENGYPAYREEYFVKNIHEARQQALFRKRILEANKMQLTGAYITYNGVKNYIKF